MVNVVMRNDVYILENSSWQYFKIMIYITC